MADILAPQFQDEETARLYLEKKRWPDGPVCPHCGVIGEATKLEPRANAKGHARKGVWRCRPCEKQFTVTVGTIFEDSHIPLHKWLLAYHLVCASKKGMSAHQLHRMLGITYKSAWFMAHRIRHTMTQEPLSAKLKGIVEVDETYVGGKEKGKRGVPGPDSKKTPVLGLVERGGNVRNFPVERVTVKNVEPILREHIAEEAELHTDEGIVYYFLKDGFGGHETVNHAKEEYARTENGKLITTNTIEGYFGIVKRGVYGIYHHWSRRHLHRYLTEFAFRYNARASRGVSDATRTHEALKGIEGKRLMYRDSCRKAK